MSIIKLFPDNPAADQEVFSRMKNLGHPMWMAIRDVSGGWGLPLPHENVRNLAGYYDLGYHSGSGDPEKDFNFTAFGDYANEPEKILDQLKKSGEIAGLPSDFDWSPYLAQASFNHYQSTGKQWSSLEDASIGLAGGAFDLLSGDYAAREKYGLFDEQYEQAEAPFVQGSPEQQQSELERQQRYNQHQEAESGVQSTFWGGLAALAGGAALSGAGAGAGAAETGLSAELAAGAPELAGTMGLSSGAGAGALSAELASGSPEAAGTMGLEQTVAATQPLTQVAQAPTGTMTDVSPGQIG